MNRKIRTLLWLLALMMLLASESTYGFYPARRDTLKAYNYYLQASNLNDSAKYQQAALLFSNAAHEYKKAKAWERYFAASIKSIDSKRNTDSRDGIEQDVLQLLEESKRRLGSSHIAIGNCYNIFSK